MVLSHSTIQVILEETVVLVSLIGDNLGIDAKPSIYQASVIHDLCSCLIFKMMQINLPKTAETNTSTPSKMNNLFIFKSGVFPV